MLSKRFSIAFVGVAAALSGLAERGFPTRKLRARQDEPEQRSSSTVKFLAISSFWSCVVVLLSFAGASGAPLISNGDFESPSIGGGSVAGVSPTSWSCTLNNYNAGGAFLVNASGGAFWGVTGGGADYFPAAVEGQQYLAIGNHAASVVSQSFIISEPAMYVLSWYDSSYYSGGVACAPYEVAITDSSSTTIGSVSLAPSQTDVWEPETMTVNLTEGTYTLDFTPTGYSSQTCPLIDSVSLEAVPEPATSGLLTAGAAGFLMRRSRRRAA
ncbi:MAG: PEP-CTERM sorting domain-containing protein [Tepidisphaeraceae bacterium]